MKKVIPKDINIDPYSVRRRKLVKPVIESIIKEAILNFDIDPRGKNEQEIRDEIFEYLDFLRHNNFKFDFYTDYRNTLLREGRKFYSLKNYEFSCVFYAIWFEHWVNNLVVIYGVKNSLSQNEIVQIIRESNIRSKLSWISKLLNIPNISTKHKTVILHLFDLRNSFVHFKWKGYFSNEDKKQKEEMNSVLAHIEKTVKYSRGFENKHLYHNSKKKVLKTIKSKA